METTPKKEDRRRFGFYYTKSEKGLEIRFEMAGHGEFVTVLVVILLFISSMVFFFKDPILTWLENF